MIVWKRFVNLIGMGTTLVRKPSPDQALLDAKYTLGERMVAAGIDDGRLGAQIDLRDSQIHQAPRNSDLLEILLADRKMLVLALAEAALEVDAPLPGADAEYQNVRSCEAALRTFTGRATPMASLLRRAAPSSSPPRLGATALAVRQ